MPQIILEHSANIISIDYSTFYAEIYASIKSIANIGTCKMRTLAQQNFAVIGDSNENAFAYLQVLMAAKPERGDEFCQAIVEGLGPIFNRHMNAALQRSGCYCKPTIEVGFLSQHYRWLN